MRVLLLALLGNIYLATVLALIVARSLMLLVSIAFPKLLGINSGAAFCPVGMPCGARWCFRQGLSTTTAHRPLRST
jgi:hypothetical protein